MNLWLRMIWLLAATPFRPRLRPPLGVSRLTFRVLPNDLDVNLHMNNGRYLTIFDLGRFDLILRMGLAGPARRQGWIPVLSAASVLFRRELRLLQKFVVETRIVWWSGTQLVMEHRALTREADGREGVAARAMMGGGIYQRKGRRFVPVVELFEAIGLPYQDPPPKTPEIETALAAIDFLRQSARETVQADADL